MVLESKFDPLPCGKKGINHGITDRENTGALLYANQCNANEGSLKSETTGLFIVVAQETAGETQLE